MPLPASTITFGLQDLLMLFLQAVIVGILILTLTRGLATKEDIQRLDEQMSQLNQNHLVHLSAHQDVVAPKP
jgi:hypothetical protein